MPRPRIQRPDPARVRPGEPDPTLTSVGGLAAFGRFLGELGIDEQLRRRFFDLKEGPRVVYPMEAQLRMLIDAAAVGANRVFDLEMLAADPLFVYLAGGGLPSLDTVYRDLRRCDETSVAQLEAMMSHHGLAELRDTRLLEVHLDVDTTVEPLFGQQEGALPGPNPHYHGRPSFHPMIARVAEADTLVGARLRPGNTGFGDDDVPLLLAWVDRTRAHLSESTRLWVRMDAAGDCTSLLLGLQQRRVRFAIKAKMTSDLRSAIAHTDDWKTVDRDAFDHPTTQVAEIDFARGVWTEAGLRVRVVAVRTTERDTGKQIHLWDDLDYTVQAYLTNDPDEPAEDLARRYNLRAGIEPLIAELKNAWGIGKIPSENFQANAAAFMVKLLTHNLLRRYVSRHAPQLKHWRAAWVRRALLRIPGRLSRSGRRRKLHLPPGNRFLPMRN